MNTLTGTQLLAVAAAVAGRDPAAPLAPADGGRLQVFVGQHLSDCWHHAPWPDLLSTPNPYLLSAGAVTKDSTMGRIYAVWSKDWRTSIDAKRLDFNDAGPTLNILPPGHSLLYSWGTSAAADPTVYVESWPPLPLTLTMSASQFAAQTFPEFLANALACKAGAALLLFDGQATAAQAAMTQSESTLLQLALPVWRSRRQLDPLKRHA